VKSAVTTCVRNGRNFHRLQIHFTLIDTVRVIINL
jgi:hypothetical protein